VTRNGKERSRLDLLWNDANLENQDRKCFNEPIHNTPIHAGLDLEWRGIFFDRDVPSCGHKNIELKH
jgi:hypothetical protein